jgi:succinyl-CoA synthetase beta subunit
VKIFCEDFVYIYRLPVSCFSLRRILFRFPFPRTTANETKPEDSAAIIKAQVLTGGRGKGYFDNGFQGGVKFLNSASKAKEVASQMLNSKLITKQAPQGLLCTKVLLRECFDIQRELYLSIIMDRQSGGPLIVASPCGGTSIEEVAATHPELIFTESIDISQGVTEEQCHNVAHYLQINPQTEAYSICVQMVRNLYQFFLENDSLQVEINPLAETPQGKLVIADAKWVVDDRASQRQQHIFSQRDTSQEDPREVFASQHCLNYVGLQGSVGCLVNGAGLSMANMDLLALKGVKPACFLDVGGGADDNAIDSAFTVLQNDPSVKVIFVNIFGGIVRCDLIAEGIIRASDRVTKPIVVRLQGTNCSRGMDLLEEANIANLITEKDWSPAADKVVSILKGIEQQKKQQQEMMDEETTYSYATSN